MTLTWTQRPTPEANMTQPAPLPPPFPVGTRLRCIEGHEAYVARVDRPRDLKDHPEDWTRSSGRGLEVTIDRVELGYCGTGRQLRDQDGPMYHDDGEPMVDTTRDGYSVYYVVPGEGRIAKQSGRCIYPDSVHRWQVLPAPLLVRAGDFFEERGPAPQIGLVLSSGPKAFDVIWANGSTTRYRHGVRDLRIVGGAEIDAHTREHLLHEAEAARRERRSGTRLQRRAASPR
jgi:hypothetical protein